MRLRQGRYTFILMFLLAPIGIYVLFVLVPYGQAIYYSLSDWTGLTADKEFIGFDNFQRLWEDDQFRVALKNNLILLVVVPTTTLVLGLFLASMLNVGGRARAGVGGVRGSSVYKVVYFFPQVLSVALVGVLFKYVFAPTNAGGILNGFLEVIGLRRLTRPSLGDSRSGRSSS